MNWNKGISIVLLVLVSGIWLMCASSKPEATNTKQAEKQKVDQLMKDKKSDTAKNQAQEDDILKKLGISDEKTGDTKKEVTSEKNAMENQVSNLENKLQEKDSEISKLKSNLENSNKKLNNLENVLTDLKTSTKVQPSPVETSRMASSSFAEYKRKYEAARQEYLRRNFNSAIRDFEELLNVDATNSLSDNCRYWIGECYYGLEMYQRAIAEFEKVFAFVNSNKEDAAQLKIGLCYKNLNQKQNARDALNRMIMKYPKSEFIGLAKQILNQL